MLERIAETCGYDLRVEDHGDRRLFELVEDWVAPREPESS